MDKQWYKDRIYGYELKIIGLFSERLHNEPKRTILKKARQILDQYTVKEKGKPTKLMFIDVGNLNTLTRFASDTSIAEAFTKWFSEEIFPLSMKDDVFNLETILDKNVAMELL